MAGSIRYKQAQCVWEAVWQSLSHSAQQVLWPDGPTR